MPIESDTDTRPIRKFWRWFQAFDAALHDDDTTALRATMTQMNQRIAQLEVQKDNF
jgi:hypothetical protein